MHRHKSLFLEVPVFALMLCFYHLKILNNYSVMGCAFSFLHWAPEVQQLVLIR